METENEEIKAAEKKYTLIWLLVALLILAAAYAAAYFYDEDTDIHFLSCGIYVNSDDEDYIDSIDGYYVAVHRGFWYYATGDDTGYQMSSIKPDDTEDITWINNELQSISVYKKDFLVSTGTTVDRYDLLAAEGENQFGNVYVIRTDSGKIYYYYQRITRWTMPETGPMDLAVVGEDIELSCDGQEIELENHIRFVSDIDFTTGERTLCIGGKPVTFVKR